MQIYIHNKWMYTYTLTHVCTDICPGYAYIFMHSQSFAYKHNVSYICICTYIHAWTYTHRQTIYAHSSIYTLWINIYLNTHTCTYAMKYTDNIYIYICKHIPYAWLTNAYTCIYIFTISYVHWYIFFVYAKYMPSIYMCMLMHKCMYTHLPIHMYGHTRNIYIVNKIIDYNTKY